MKKTKNKNKRSGEIKPIKFLVIWLVAAAIVWPTFFFIYQAINTLISGIATVLFDGYVSILYYLPFYLSGVVLGIAGGLSIGIWQKIVMKQLLHIQPKRWIALSTFGGFIGGTFFTVFNRLSIFNSFGEANNIGIVLGLILAFISFSQWFALRQKVHDAWLWVLANTVGGMTSMIILFNILTRSIEINVRNDFEFFLLLIGSVILLAMILGLTTGGTMLWLFQNRRIPQQRQNAIATESIPLFEQPSQSDDSDLSHLIEPDQLDSMTTGS